MAGENIIPTETSLGGVYEMQRNLTVEFGEAKLQRVLARADVSTCRETKWGSFDGGCEVYHELFYTAEILNKVSSPRHHPELFLDALSAIVTVDSPMIWIPAAATPRTYDMMRFVKPKATAVATDLCVTPIATLGISRAKDMGNNLLFGQRMNVFDSPFHSMFDVIAIDAFLTRFNRDDRFSVSKILYKALKPGGVLLTTMRIPQFDETADGQMLERETAESASYVDGVVEAYQALSPKVGNKNMPYETEQELRADATYYRNTMKSAHAIENGYILERELMMKLERVPNATAINMMLIEAGFETVSSRISKPVYDVTTRQYLQIAAIK